MFWILICKGRLPTIAFIFKCSWAWIPFQWKVPQRWDSSKNYYKSKGYPSKTPAAAFTMQKAYKGLERPPLKYTYNLRNLLPQTGDVYITMHMQLQQCYNIFLKNVCHQMIFGCSKCFRSVTWWHWLNMIWKYFQCFQRDLFNFFNVMNLFKQWVSDAKPCTVILKTEKRW